jgi:hypothetical protein
MTNRNCTLTRNILGRWILTHVHSRALGWSGSQWVEVDENGIGITTQVSNFDTRKEAAQYADECHLKVNDDSKIVLTPQ